MMQKKPLEKTKVAISSSFHHHHHHRLQQYQLQDLHHQLLLHVMEVYGIQLLIYGIVQQHHHHQPSLYLHHIHHHHHHCHHLTQHLYHIHHHLMFRHRIHLHLHLHLHQRYHHHLHHQPTTATKRRLTTDQQVRKFVFLTNMLNFFKCKLLENLF